MSFLSDLHTHTLISDGRSTAEEYIEEALSRGFLSLGFSEHSYTDFDLSFCMSEERRELYFEKTPLLKEKYAGKIELYMGEEFDIFSDPERERIDELDYVIGACHYVDVGDCRRAVDYSDSFSTETAKKYFGGDYAAYAAGYFEKISELAGISNVGIIAHFDLVTKFNEGGRHFDESDPRYRSASLDAMEKLVRAGKIFEINTGAMSRGYRSEPYPSRFLLRALREMDGKITFSSDSHTFKNIGFGFDNAIKTAKECGFESAYMLYHGEFISVKL